MKIFCINLLVGFLLPTILCQSTPPPATTNAPTTKVEPTTVAPTASTPQQTEKTTIAPQASTTEATKEITEATVEDEETTKAADEESDFSWSSLTQAFSSLTDNLSTEDLAAQIGAIITKVVNSLPTKEDVKDVSTKVVNSLPTKSDVLDVSTKVVNSLPTKSDATSFIENLPSISDVVEKLDSAENVIGNVESHFEALLGYLPESLLKPVKDFINATIDEPFKVSFLDPLGSVSNNFEGIVTAIDRVDNALWWLNRAAVALVISSVIVFAFKVNIGFDVLGWLLGWKFKAVSHLFGLVSQTGYNSVGWVLGETGIVKKRRDEVFQFHHQNPQRSISRTAPILKSLSDSYTKYQDGSASHTNFPYSDYTA